MTAPTPALDTPPIFSLTSLLSLTAVATLLGAAYLASTSLLPKAAPAKTRTLFTWHAFDAFVHLTLEASFLWNCFFVSAPRPQPSLAVSQALFDPIAAARGDIAWSALRDVPMTPLGVNFLSLGDRLYGAFYGEGVLSKLWQEYARADRRWGGADLTVISLELLTVFVMAPAGLYACYLLSAGRARPAAFWMSVVATGELYGGFMTFAPEWLSGNTNLDGSNFMYMWVYLFFMNMLWVFFPLWVLYEAYDILTGSAVRVATEVTPTVSVGEGKKGR